MTQLAADRRAVATARKAYEAYDPRVETDRAGLDAVAVRPEVRAAFAQHTWRTEMVNLEDVLSVQKFIRLTGLEERVAPVGEDPARLLEFCLPTEQPVLPGAVFTDTAAPGMAISSLNPNLRIAGAQPVPIQAQTAPNAPPVQMLGMAVLVHMGTSYLQVAGYNGRYFLRDGYHRASGLLHAGITTVPCIFIEAQSFEEVVPGPGLFTYETMFSNTPPRLTDFWIPEVSDEVVRPAVRKVIRVRGDEFFVQV